jgi:hypothetical protein
VLFEITFQNKARPSYIFLAHYESDVLFFLEFQFRFTGTTDSKTVITHAAACGRVDLYTITSHLPHHLTSGPSKCRSLYDDRTEILFRARDGIAAPVGGTRVDKSTLLCGVDCGVSSSAGDTLLSVDSLSGVGVAEEEEAIRGIGKSDAGRLRREPVLFGPATVWVAQALSIAPQRHRFSSFFAIPSRLPLVW